MTKTEPKYRAGQIAHVRMRVRDDGPGVMGLVSVVTLGLPAVLSLIDPADIVSVEPEQLAAGDMVTVRDSPGCPWRIVAIHDNRAWCLDRLTGRFTTAALSCLVRA